MKALKTMALAGLLASIMISGCDCGDSEGDIDAAVSVDGGIQPDGGDAAVVPPDGGIEEDGGDLPDAELPDGGGPDAGGLTFADFVKDVYDNPENSTPVDLPDPDLPDNEDPNEYNTLFP